MSFVEKRFAAKAKNTRMAVSRSGEGETRSSDVVQGVEEAKLE